MKKALAGVLAVALAGLMAGSAVAQVPNVQVYFDANYTQTQTLCSSGTANLYVVMNNWNMNVTGVDFSIDYPPAVAWLFDTLPLPALSQAIGDSPTGIAIAYANCCDQNGFKPILVLKPFVQWGPCDCNQAPQAIVVGGYAPLGKVNPSAVRKEDFQEFTGVGMTSLICPGPIATEQSTWGQVKALYR